MPVLTPVATPVLPAIVATPPVTDVHVPPLVPEASVEVVPTGKASAPVMAAGVGFTEIVKFCAGPVQPFAAGVTVNTPAIWLEPELVAINEAIVLPTPDAPMPIEVLLFDQE